MTNYRITICKEHDAPQFKYCFDCGAPLKREEVEGAESLTCSKNWVHVRIFLEPHIGDLEEGNCPEKEFE